MFTLQAKVFVKHLTVNKTVILIDADNKAL